MMGSFGGEGGSFLLMAFEVENHLKRNSRNMKKGTRGNNNG